MKRLKKLLSLILGVMLMTMQLSACADEPRLITENGKIIINNAVENGTLIAAFYQNGVLIGARTYTGSGQIEVDLESELNGDLSDATDLKAFFWDMEKIRPLCDLLPLKLGTTADTPAPTPEPTLSPTPTPTPTLTPIPTPTPKEENQLKIKIGNKEFSAALENNETANALKAMLPMTLDMSELNGNEKYCNLSESLPTKTESIGTIHAGDIMLWGSNCIVIFYETFNTSYSYTRIGHIDDVTELKSALGSGSVNVGFEIY